MNTRLPLFLAVPLLLAISPAPAAVTLPHVIGDNMVLQRDLPVPIWGSAAPDEKVTVTFAGQTKTALAGKDGKWLVTLDKLTASDQPAELTVEGASGGEKLVRKNVLVGEVWLASGQSNMYLEVKSLKDRTGPTRAAADKLPTIRLLRVPDRHAGQPLADVGANWNVCSGGSVNLFSACGFFFAAELSRELNVPIGVMMAAKGGEFIEEFTPGLSGKAYNAMVAPLAPFAMRGVIWYQGEANAIKGNSLQYVDMQTKLIAQWRKAWGRDFSFYYVQIAPLASWYKGESLQLLWQAQRELLKVPGTGMVVTTDCVSDGIKNIHPRNKWDVGKRLALWALARDYGRKELVHSGPLFKSAAFADGKATLAFDHVGGGLAVRKGGALSHFEIAGADRKFMPAEATIARSPGSAVDDVLVVSSPDVKTPAIVRFAWDRAALPNFINKEGLPASPFTTEPFADLQKSHK